MILLPDDDFYDEIARRRVDALLESHQHSKLAIMCRMYSEMELTDPKIDTPKEQ